MRSPLQSHAATALRTTTRLPILPPGCARRGGVHPPAPPIRPAKPAEARRPAMRPQETSRSSGGTCEPGIAIVAMHGQRLFPPDHTGQRLEVDVGAIAGGHILGRHQGDEAEVDQPQRKPSLIWCNKCSTGARMSALAVQHRVGFTTLPHRCHLVVINGRHFALSLCQLYRSTIQRHLLGRLALPNSPSISRPREVRRGIAASLCLAANIPPYLAPETASG